MRFAQQRDRAKPAAPSRNSYIWIVIACLFVGPLVASLALAVASDASARAVQQKKSSKPSSPARAAPHNSVGKNRATHMSESGKWHKPGKQVHQKQPKGKGPPGSASHNPSGVIVHTPPLTVPPVISTVPPILRSPTALSQGPSPPRPRSSLGRGPRNSGAPPAGQTHYVLDEVMLEVDSRLSPRAIELLARRHTLTPLESRSFQLANATVYRWRIPDNRSVRAVIRALEADRQVRSAQPNYLFDLSEDSLASASPLIAGDPAQYSLAKMRIPEAHALARGNGVVVAVIDSSIDGAHPELSGAIAGRFDAVRATDVPDAHGTGVAGAISARGRLLGTAPASRILAVRAFGGDRAEGTTFNIMTGIDWAATNGARVLNMSFAGPKDPMIARELAGAHQKGIIVVAASGNAGPNSSPLYPAADPTVIAVTATDASDNLFSGSNRGAHIAVAAPGTDILHAVPASSYGVSSGTSLAAAHVSGLVALLLERRPKLTPDQVRNILVATATDLGPKGRDDQFGAGLVDAHRALSTVDRDMVGATASGAPAQ